MENVTGTVSGAGEPAPRAADGDLAFRAADGDLAFRATDEDLAFRAATADLAFRAATAADVPALVALVESAYRGESSRTGWTTEADLLLGQRTDPQGVAQIVADPGSVLLTAEREGGLVACCQLQQRGDSAYFGMFAVRPELQGAGVGKAVLAAAERMAVARWDAREMQMTVITQRDDLIAWYERRGYTRTGELSPFPYGDERFGIPQRDDLAFELLVKPLRPRPS